MRAVRAGHAPAELPSTQGHNRDKHRLLSLSRPFLRELGIKGLKADFGSGLWDGGPIGIPSVVVPATQAKVRVTFDYADELSLRIGYQF